MGVVSSTRCRPVIRLLCSPPPVVFFQSAVCDLGHCLDRDSSTDPDCLCHLLGFSGQSVPLCPGALHHRRCCHLPGGFLWMPWSCQRKQLHDVDVLNFTDRHLHLRSCWRNCCVRPHGRCQRNC